VVVIGEIAMDYEELAYDGYYVSEVLGPVKSGKEATVFCCSAQAHTGLDLIAAKVYRPLKIRQFRNDAVYQRGRYIKDTRLRRAYHNKSRAGQAAQFSRWITAEYETMELLYSAGADIPHPHALSGSAILMEYVGEEDQPAVTLNQAHLQKPEAREHFQTLIRNIGLWLSLGRVHADLSPFNVLYWNGTIRVIDFPQSVDPYANNSAFSLLVRDVENICRHFRQYDIEESGYDIASAIWAEHAERRV
jgi:RIO kinase 1